MDKQEAIASLCSELDILIYEPMKEFIHKTNLSINLGYLKEKFKLKIEEVINNMELY